MNRKLPFRKVRLLCAYVPSSLWAWGAAFSSLIPAVASPSFSSSTTWQEAKKVGSIKIQIEPSAQEVDPQAILSQLKTRSGDLFSQAAFDSDLKTLLEKFEKVEPVIQTEKETVNILLKLSSRPLIQSITWKGNHHIKTKALQKLLNMKTKEAFDTQKWNHALQKIRSHYLKKGYFESEVSYQVVPDPASHTVCLTIQIEEGRLGKIEKLLFRGFTKEEKKTLLEMIPSKKYNLFTSWFKKTGFCQEEVLQQDKFIILNFLHNKGYADAQVELHVLPGSSPDKVVLEICADKGTLYYLDLVSFTGNKLFRDEEIQKVLLLQPNQVYSPEKIRLTAEAMRTLYGRKGYIDANIQYDTKLDETKPLYQVHFTIEEGMPYKVGLIHVIGNKHTQTRVILHESLLVPGEIFDSAKLQATQTRLANVGYFKSVTVYAVRPEKAELLGEHYRDVYIEVEEGSTGNVHFFSGFSTADNIFGGLGVGENNFNYKGFSRVFKEGYSALKGGGEYAHARVSIGSKQTNYSLSWLTPYFKDTLWRVGFDLNKNRSSLQSKDYLIDTIGLSLYGSYPLTPYWSVGCKYRIRDARIHVDRKVSKEELKEERNSGLLSAIGGSLTFDSTDSALKPTKGFRSILETEYAGLAGDFRFGRFGYINTYYRSFWPKGVFKTRADFRFIEPLGKTNHADHIPLNERFFLGGENSVRGYRPFSLGDKYPNKDPKGGITSSVLSVEYMHTLHKILDGFIFFDTGTVSLKKIHLSKYMMSYGVGARLEIINRIPLIVGMGFPINPNKRSEVHRFFISVGGQF